MDKSKIRLWIRLLESGKYRCNGGGRLKTEDGKYSAAGVITEYFLGKSDKKEQGGSFIYDGNFYSLGPDILQKLKISYNDLCSYLFNNKPIINIFQYGSIKDSIKALKYLLTLG